MSEFIKVCEGMALLFGKHYVFIEIHNDSESSRKIYCKNIYEKQWFLMWHRNTIEYCQVILVTHTCWITGWIKAIPAPKDTDHNLRKKCTMWVYTWAHWHFNSKLCFIYSESQKRGRKTDHQQNTWVCLFLSFFLLRKIKLKNIWLIRVAILKYLQILAKEEQV